jgi:hypothetical protein
MKQYIFLCLGCVLGIAMAGNSTNKTLTVNNDLLTDGDDEGFYTVDVLLIADRASTEKTG